jgi:hypothetical protein
MRKKKINRVRDIISDQGEEWALEGMVRNSQDDWQARGVWPMKLWDQCVTFVFWQMVLGYLGFVS